MEKYYIKQVVVNKPEIELPIGSQAVNIKHHSALDFEDGIFYPECWQVIYLEPIEKSSKGGENK